MNLKAQNHGSTIFPTQFMFKICFCFECFVELHVFVLFNTTFCSSSTFDIEINSLASTKSYVVQKAAKQPRIAEAQAFHFTGNAHSLRCPFITFVRRNHI